MIKLNCWEIKKCGREPGGSEVAKCGVCPATLPGKGYGANGGKNRGRICWLVANTFCGNKIQRTLFEKERDCPKCKIFLRIKKEEGKNLQLSLENNLKIIPLLTVFSLFPSALYLC